MGQRPRTTSAQKVRTVLIVILGFAALDHCAGRDSRPLLEDWKFLKGGIASDQQAEESRNSQTPPREIPLFKHNDTVCLVGDSITHSGAYHSYVFLYCATRFPQDRLKFINCGISGDSSPGMLGRLDRDVFSNNATVATVSARMNDVNRGLYSQVKILEDAENAKRKAIDGFKNNIRQISAALLEKGVRPVFLTPTIYDENFESTVESLRGVNAALGECSDFVMEFAKAQKAPVVDFWHPMNEINARRQQADPRFTLTGKDRVHPGPAGHFVMAYLFLDQTGAPREVWHLSLDAESGKILEQSKSEASHLVSTPSGLSFFNKEMALPFPMIEEAKEALELVPFTDRLNQQTLQIRGLGEGDYNLKINGKAVGNYPQSILEKGINLATNAATPQNALAQKIAGLCREHHSLGSTIRTLRRVEMKHLKGIDLSDKSAVKASLEAFIAEKKARKNDPEANSGYYIKTAQTYLQQIGNEVAIRQRIQTLEDEIYRINQPQTYSYALQKADSTFPSPR